jgi:hypothetical protein
VRRSQRNARVVRHALGLARRARAGADGPQADAAEVRALRARLLRAARLQLRPMPRGTREWFQAAISAGTGLAMLANRERELAGVPVQLLADFRFPAGLAGRLAGTRLGDMAAQHDRLWPPPAPSPILVPDTRLVVPGRPA